MVDLTYPTSLKDSTVNPAWIQFAFYDRYSPKDSAPKDKISLYMPESASAPSTASWDTEKFGFVGNAVGAGASAFNNSANSGMRRALDGVNAAWNAVQGGGDLIMAQALANVGSAAVGLMGGSVSAEGLMGAVAGKIPNPYLTMVFRGIDFRNFAFVFKFYPFQESDCTLIDNIIKTFRANQLSDYESGNTMLSYPAECQISYKWLDDNNPWLHKFKRAVCTAVDVDYTPTGMFSTMRNGFPSEITVSTKWSEMELVTRSDVAEGY